MTLTRTFRLRLLCAAAALLASSASQAYFVRPFVQLGASAVDGLVHDGVTERAVNFTSDLKAEVNLAEGTSRNFLRVTGPGVFGQSAGVMSDSINVVGAQGTNLDFSFGFDGTVMSPARDPSLNADLQIGINAYLRVFNAGSGADYTNFVSHPGALVTETLNLNFNNPTEALELAVLENLMGSLNVTSVSPLNLDVFASFSAFVSTNGNPVTVTMDFMNTGNLRLATAPGVSFTSDSGVFLTQTTPVPEPATWALMALGLVAVAGGAGRQRRRHGATAQTRQASLSGLPWPAGMPAQSSTSSSWLRSW